MFDWHVVIWLDDAGTENASSEQDRIAAEKQARILLGLGRNLLAIKRANEIVMDLSAVRKLLVPQSR
jgi:hypothetical protein